LIFCPHLSSACSQINDVVLRFSLTFIINGSGWFLRGQRYGSLVKCIYSMLSRRIESPSRVHYHFVPALPSFTSLSLPPALSKPFPLSKYIQNYSNIILNVPRFSWLQSFHFASVNLPTLEQDIDDIFAPDQSRFVQTKAKDRNRLFKLQYCTSVEESDDEFSDKEF
jgi:hypothetical protein